RSRCPSFDSARPRGRSAQPSEAAATRHLSRCRAHRDGSDVPDAGAPRTCTTPLRQEHLMSEIEMTQHPVSESVAALDRLVGHWDVTGEAVGTVTYEWLEGGYFLLQR